MSHLRHLLGVLIVLLAAAALAQTEYEATRAPAIQRLGEQVQAVRLNDARRDLLAYLDRFPGDAVMQYNLACLEALAGDSDAALARLDTAFEAGYRDLARPRSDPDLVTLAADPRLDALLEEVRAGLVAGMLAAEMVLEEGVWSEPQSLAADPFAPPSDDGAGHVRVRYDADGLAVAITPPPAGADEAVVCVALPRSLEEHETDRWFEFRAALDAPGPVARTARHGRPEPAAAAGELAGDGAPWTVHLPWSSLHPYRPPVELLLGLDVTLRRESGTVPAARWALVRDPHAGSSLVRWRRFAPLILDPGPSPARVVAGRLDTYLVVGDSLSVELGIQGLPGGELRVSQSVNDRPDTAFAATVEPELAYLTLDYRLPAEPSTGWFELSATVTPADGSSLAWRDRCFRLPPAWFLEQQERLAGVSAVESPLVRYQLLRTLRGQQDFQPHDDPSDLAATAILAGEYLDRFEATGTVLPPAGGLVNAAFPLGDDALQACRLVLPAAARRGDGALVVVVTDSRDAARSMAEALAAGRVADEPRTFLVMPVQAVAGRPDLAVAAIQDAAAWGRMLIAAPAVRLAGTAGVQQFVFDASLGIDDVPAATMLLTARFSGRPPDHVTVSGPIAANPAAWAAAILAWN